MTRTINRYSLHDLKVIRIRKKGSGKTVELRAEELLQSSDGYEFNDIRILEDFQAFQSLLKRLKEKKDFEIEFDYDE